MASTINLKSATNNTCAMTFNGTSDVSVDLSTVPSYSNLVGMKNIIINGAMNVWQYGTTATTLTTSGATRMADRFYTALSITSGAIQTTQDTTTQYNGQAYNWLKNTVTTALVYGSSGFCGIEYRIEDNDIYNLRNGNVTLSFLFNTNVAGTYSVAFRNYALSVSYVTTFTAVSGTQKISLTVNLNGGIGTSGLTPLATPSNTGGLVIDFCFVAGSTYQTSTLNTWSSTPSLQLSTSTNWTTTVGNYVAISQVQLEAGTVATPFENRSIGLETALCQRYYEAANAYIVGAYYTGVQALTSIPFKVLKRVVPTMTYNNISYTNSNSLITNIITANAVIPQFTTTSNLGVASFSYSASAEL